MWAKLDCALLDHRKIFAAGELLGKDGAAIALGFYAAVLMWSNRQLADGHLSQAVIKSFPHVDKPLAVADALATAGLLDRNGNGYVIHDYGDFNMWAADVKKRRKAEVKRVRAAREKAKDA